MRLEKCAALNDFRFSILDFRRGSPEIENPDFSQDLKPISELIAQENFPAGALGRFVEVNGYSGVVVQILNHSLKIRSREGTSRRYNADTLRRLHSGK